MSEVFTPANNASTSPVPTTGEDISSSLTCQPNRKKGWMFNNNSDINKTYNNDNNNNNNGWMLNNNSNINKTYNNNNDNNNYVYDRMNNTNNKLRTQQAGQCFSVSLSTSQPLSIRSYHSYHHYIFHSKISYHSYHIQQLSHLSQPKLSQLSQLSLQ